MTAYVPYHVHSMLSNGTVNIDSITDFHAYVDKAAALGMTSFGFAEHGNLFSWLKKKEYIESKGMKYIHAVEAYITENLDEKVRDNYHIVLIAKNEHGVRELNSLVSKSFCRTDNHFYYVPRISFDELLATSENILITTACLGGILSKGTASIKEKFITFLQNNTSRCFLEIQHHPCKEQSEHNKLLLSLHNSLHIPLITGTDTHALDSSQLEGRSILQKAKGISFPDEQQWDLTFKSPDELLQSYIAQAALPQNIVLEAMENTIRMSEMVSPFTVDYSPKYPKLYDNSEEVFKQKINEGVIKRGINKLPNYSEYKSRILEEFAVYKHNGAIDFMLLEENYKSEMRKQGVRFGYSRGSVSGSLIAYLLGITEIDSVKYNLNFSRFMNPERVSLADVDTDWYSPDRKLVKDYLYHKKGLYCCDIVTFNTIAIKGAVRDVGRALGMKLEEVSAIADVCEEDSSVRKKYPELFRLADMVTGTVVSVGNHPAGVVVSPFPVEPWFGTFTTSTDENPIAMLNMKEIDFLNFVKLDILALDNVGLIYKTCDAAHIPYATPDNTPPDDNSVWQEIREDTTLVFQWESPMATAYVKQLFSDKTVARFRKRNPDITYMQLFSMGNAALRPAGASYRDKLSCGESFSFGNEALDKFFSTTMGYMIYQEQIIEFLHTFCGFTMGEADTVRRGFAKKTGTEQFIPKIKSGFAEYMAKNYSLPQAESENLISSVLTVIEDASSYLFSKNHADPYSWIGYITGCLRHYYPLEFLTTALNIFQDNSEKTAAIIAYCKKHGVTVAPITFRHSGAEYTFSKEENTIYKGISSIKYMNAKAADELYALRNLTFQDFPDLLKAVSERTSLNSRQVKILIQLDFFREFGESSLLLLQKEIFEQYSKTSYNKSKIPKTENFISIIRHFSAKETEKMFLGVDSQSLIKSLSAEVQAPSTSLKDKIAAQLEYMGYISVTGEQYKGMAAVTDVDTTYSPKVALYSLFHGTTEVCKITKRNFKKAKLAKGDIIKVIFSEYRPKQRKTDTGQWQPSATETELWLTDYIVLTDI